jgi:hypothetical protein
MYGVWRKQSDKTHHNLSGAADRSIEGKQINVGRVALHECQICGHLMPTRAGQAKVDRLVAQGIQFYLGNLR